MFDQKEHQPGDRAPATAHYEELNVFGSPTGSVADVRFHRHRAALRGGADRGGPEKEKAARKETPREFGDRRGVRLSSGGYSSCRNGSDTFAVSE